MTLKKFLKEGFANFSTDFIGRALPIFTFPLEPKEKKELLDRSKYFRFIADLNTKTVYIFDSDLTHARAAKALNLEYSFKSEEVKTIAIFGEVDKNFNMTDSYNVNEIKAHDKKLFQKYKDSDWSFAKEFIGNIDEILFKNKYKEV